MTFADGLGGYVTRIDKRRRVEMSGYIEHNLALIINESLL